MDARFYFMNEKRENGITLTALIITIVVLIVLTGISIGTTQSGLKTQKSTSNVVNKYNSVMQEQIDDLDEMNIDKN